MVSCCKFDKDGKLLREKIKKTGEIFRPGSSGKRYIQQYSSEDINEKKINRVAVFLGKDTFTINV